MTPHAVSPTWSDANQQVLVAEFARLRARLEAGDDWSSAHAEAYALRMADARRVLPAPAAIDALADAFALSSFERDLLLLAAGVEMDAALAVECAAAVGDSRQPGPTFALALAVLDEPHWSALAPVRPLRRWRLVETEGHVAQGLARGRLRIDERILHYLAGVNYLDVRLQGLVRRHARAIALATAHREVVADAEAWLAEVPDAEAPVVVLCGNDASGRLDVAAEIASSRGMELHVLRAEDVPATADELDAFATLWQREARLSDVALVVAAGEDALSPAALRLIDRVRVGALMVSASQSQLLDRPSRQFVVDRPEPDDQRALWMSLLGAQASVVEPAIGALSAQFRFSARVIATQAEELRPALAVSDQPAELIWARTRAISRTRLDSLAARIETRATWDDLILPEAQKSILREIESQVRHRLTVHGDWGFGVSSTRGLGITALFAGESGTGKTMAAEVLGRELRLDLYRIDLSAVTSKYIGETEKNLRRVFDAAEEAGAILLFDEADALFGKRSEVKDSHDRYANLEVSYLLQRMEAYQGLAILTTNLKASLDTAFQRRLRFVVQFPFPDHALREAIWRRAFPAQAPLGEIEYASLARLNVAGGNIRNIALAAAFSAAGAGEPITMQHLLRAARQDASKRDRVVADAEVRGWT